MYVNKYIYIYYLYINMCNNITVVYTCIETGSMAMAVKSLDPSSLHVIHNPSSWGARGHAGHDGCRIGESCANILTMWAPLDSYVVYNSKTMVYDT